MNKADKKIPKKKYKVYRCFGVSMLPWFSEGAIAFIDALENRFQVGDIVAFRDGRQRAVIHRIISIRSGNLRMVTMGDSNIQNNDGDIHPAKVLGKVEKVVCHGFTVDTGTLRFKLAGKIFIRIKRISSFYPRLSGIFAGLINSSRVHFILHKLISV